jgi:hypothetical protein
MGAGQCPYASELFAMSNPLPRLRSMIGTASTPWRQFKRPSPKEWRVMIVDPDGCPGEIFLLDIQQVSRLVTHLRRELEHGTA